MVKAFAEYQEQEVGPEQDLGDENDDNAIDYPSEYEIADEVGQIPTVDVNLILSDSGNCTEVFLPKHMRCASHTLNLIATNDFDKIVTADSGTYKRLIRSSLAKCSKLWTNVSRSTKSSDTVAEIIGLSLRSPGETRWNATYDAIKRLMEPRVRDNLASVMDSLKMTRFKKVEIDILQEYLTIMGPISTALDKLQGETNCFLGLLMPTIQQVHKKLTVIAATVEHSGPTVDSLIQSLESCLYVCTVYCY